MRKNEQLALLLGGAALFVWLYQTRSQRSGGPGGSGGNGTGEWWIDGNGVIHAGVSYW